jgi:diaminopimelate epimerase
MIVEPSMTHDHPSQTSATNDIDEPDQLETLLAEFNGLQFTKMCGSGNDFVVIDNRIGRVQELLMPDFARRVCSRRLSVGADGVVLISEPDPPEQDGEARFDFRWRYFNADGSEGEMCGNGAMCGARFAYTLNISGPCSRFQTMSGPVEAEVDREGSAVRLQMPDTGQVTCDITVELEDIIATVHFVRVGVPHIVWIVEDADRFADARRFEQIGRALRYHERFAPSGTNVNVVSVRPDGALRMRTYERGVEAETLACGTGAVATAAVGAALGLSASPVSIAVSSGGILHVMLDWAGDHAQSVALEGQARVIMSGQLSAEALQTWEIT